MLSMYLTFSLPSLSQALPLPPLYTSRSSFMSHPHVEVFIFRLHYHVRVYFRQVIIPFLFCLKSFCPHRKRKRIHKWKHRILKRLNLRIIFLTLPKASAVFTILVCLACVSCGCLLNHYYFILENLV